MLNRRIRRGLAAVVALVAVAAACTAAPPSTLTISTVASGLNRPWDIAFTSDGTLMFTERVGRVAVVANGQRRILAEPTDVVASGEGGMMGLAIDPAFATNRRIYTCFLSDAGGTLGVRIVRWTVDAGYTALANRTDIVTGLPAISSGRHSGCRPRFGPDGHLWVGTGDSARNSVPQDPTSLGGKVLRVTTDGAAAPGNPGGALDPRIYTYGHRNVQGISFSPGGRAYSIEHGTGRDDEVNLLVAGANYGWDPVPVGGGTNYDESRPMTDLGRYPDAKVAVWSSGSPTIAPSGGTFLNGAQWLGWQRCLAMAVLKSTQLRVLCFDGAGTAVTRNDVRITDRGRLRVAVQGPDGNLYIATDADPGSILKVVPTNPT